MLKLTYTESGLYWESLTQPWEIWVNTRVLLALRSGTSLWIEPTKATFVVPSNLLYLGDLVNIIQENPEDNLSLSFCGEDDLEINLKGSWLSSDAESAEGIFVCGLGDRTESLLCHLWKVSQVVASVVQE